jgi:DNA-binding transcriptional ArsR family regulator
VMSNAPTPLTEWRYRAVERLPSHFAKRAQRIAPLPIFWPLLADSTQSIRGEVTFDVMLRALGNTSPAELRSYVLSGIFHAPATVQSLVSREKNLRRVIAESSPAETALLTHFGLGSYDSRSQSARTISALVDHPESFRDELCALLEQFWKSGFGEDWAQLEPEMQSESVRIGDLREDLSLGKLADRLALPVTFDDTAREVTSRGGVPIPYDRIEGCHLIPSAFNTRRWWAKYESKSGRFTLYFPVLTGTAGANHLARPARSAKASPDYRNISAEWVFRALGDTTRYAIASILARTPTSSAELARAIGVSKPTITHHIQALRSAGLIKETPAGGSTKLSLDRETVGAVSGAALEQLFSSSADLSLSTTRKRRTPRKA